MTLRELLAKNAAIAARRAQEAAAKKLAAAKDVAPEPEADGCDTGATEEILDEGKKEEKRPTPTKKRGRKPAQRTYMVAEDVEEVNSRDE